MQVYLPDKADDPTTLIPQFRRIIDLYGAGVLGDNAEVWIDPNDGDAQKFWVLTDRSSLVYYLETPVPGHVRLNKNRVRWAPTYDASGNSDAVVDLDLRALRDGIGGSLRLDAATNFTIVIDSPSRDSHVNVIDYKRVEMRDGYYLSDWTGSVSGIAIIDLQRFVPTFHYYRQSTDSPDEWEIDPNPVLDGDTSYMKLHAAPSAYDKAHAMVQGTELLTARMSPINRSIVRSSIDEHAVELTPQILAEADRRARGVFQAMATGALKQLDHQLKDAPPLRYDDDENGS